MKKTVLLLLGGLFLWAVPAIKAAADAPKSTASMKATAVTPKSTASDWYLGLGLGADVPSQNWDSQYRLAGGGNFFFGNRLDRSLALQLSLSPNLYSGDGLTVADLRVSPELHLSLPASGWAFYLLAGPGYDFQFNSPTGYNTSSLALVTGLGFDFELGRGQHAFIEGRYDFLLYKNITQDDFPILIGLSEDL